MAQAAELLTPARASETKLVAGVCFAHLVSHYYMLMLAPLFAFIRADFGVTYTELSLALTTFNVVSAVSQTPVGFFIDRTGARINLIGGLLLGSAGRCSPSWASPIRSTTPPITPCCPSASRRDA
jgi:MFS transporter, FSR family, fosmidomycin resistance protein